MKLHAGPAPELADLDILLKEARVETRREAARLHELTYGTEPMAAEADLYLIKRYGRRPGPGHRADTMSSHDTAALDADQEERSADVVTGGRDEPPGPDSA